MSGHKLLVGRPLSIEHKPHLIFGLTTEGMVFIGEAPTAIDARCRLLRILKIPLSAFRYHQVTWLNGYRVLVLLNPFTPLGYVEPLDDTTKV